MPVRGLVLVILLLFLAGCALAPAEPPAPTSPAEAAPTVSAAPPPAPITPPASAQAGPVAGLAVPPVAPAAAQLEVCSQRTPADQFLERLPEAARKSLVGHTFSEVSATWKSLFPPCFRVEPVSENHLLVVVIAWSDWHPVLLARSVPHGWVVSGVVPSSVGRLHLVRFWEDSSQSVFIFLDEVAGTGRFMQFLKVTLDSSGELHSQELTSGYGKAAVKFVSDELILVTYRGKLRDNLVSATCNGCIPSFDQDLLRWSGTGYTVAATRAFTTPEITLNLLREAILMGDDATALQYLAVPTLLEEARRVLAAPWLRWTTLGQGEESFWLVEAYNWDALPESVRKDLPADQRRFSAFVGPSRVSFERGPARWVVTGFAPR